MMTSKLHLLCFYLYFLFLPLLHSIEITPPPTPSPTKAGGKKRAIANSELDDDDVFVPRYDI